MNIKNLPFLEQIHDEQYHITLAHNYNFVVNDVLIKGAEFISKNMEDVIKISNPSRLTSLSIKEDLIKSIRAEDEGNFTELIYSDKEDYHNLTKSFSCWERIIRIDDNSYYILNRDNDYRINNVLLEHPSYMEIVDEDMLYIKNSREWFSCIRISDIQTVMENTEIVYVQGNF